jgi:hypothetical protein
MLWRRPYLDYRQSTACKCRRIWIIGRPIKKHEKIAPWQAPLHEDALVKVQLHTTRQWTTSCSGRFTPDEAVVSVGQGAVYCRSRLGSDDDEESHWNLLVQPMAHSYCNHSAILDHVRRPTLDHSVNCLQFGPWLIRQKKCWIHSTGTSWDGFSALHRMRRGGG